MDEGWRRRAERNFMALEVDGLELGGWDWEGRWEALNGNEDKVCRRSYTTQA